jgi:hypothetical protein
MLPCPLSHVSKSVKVTPGISIWPTEEALAVRIALPYLDNELDRAWLGAISFVPISFSIEIEEEESESE